MVTRRKIKIKQKVLLWIYREVCSFLQFFGLSSLKSNRTFVTGYLNPNFKSNHIFENSFESIVRSYDINAPVIELPYNKMDITAYCLFLKESKRRLMLLATLHLLPLPLNIKQIVYLGVICSSIRTELLISKIENFTMETKKIYAK